MTYIAIDTTDKQSKAFLDYVKTLPFAKIQSGDNVTTIKAMSSPGKVRPPGTRMQKSLFHF